jgi:hypothetical protein
MTARLATDACHLYRVVDTVRGKFYIGKHGGREQKGYWGSGMRIKRHIKKHGLQDMRYEVLVIADEQYILDLERRYVTDEFIKANSDCLNVCNGGMGGNLGHAPWNKGLKLAWVSEMMTRIHKGNTYRRGSKHTPETKKKISEAKLGKQTWSKGTVGIVKAWNKGMSFPERCVPAEKVTCPHCNQTGGIGAMKRWHFENCRTKEQI